jgi:hypothetical protein
MHKRVAHEYSKADPRSNCWLEIVCLFYLDVINIISLIQLQTLRWYHENALYLDMAPAVWNYGRFLLHV